MYLRERDEGDERGEKNEGESEVNGVDGFRIIHHVKSLFNAGTSCEDCDNNSKCHRPLCHPERVPRFIIQLS